MDEIKINIKSSRCLDPTILGASFDEWYEELEPSDQTLIRFNMEVYSADKYGERLEDIGYAWGTVLDLEYGAHEEPYFFFELCDSVSQDLCDMASAVINKRGLLKKHVLAPDEQMVYLDRIYIKPDYRNLGIGRYIMDEIGELLNYFCQLSPDVMVIVPSPQAEIDGQITSIKDNKEYREKKNKLVEYYTSCGFEKIANEDHMFKRLSPSMITIF